ncbi:MAG: MarR family transcriptional regulator [Capnocytophaga sp.]|nr:MarR family transcriptional regulator [Capnocytophaga sp.]
MFTFLEQEDIYHLIINRTATAMARAITSDFKEKNIPINKEQFSVLIVLWKKDGCAQQVLSEYTNRDKPGITRLIDTMEREGLVYRKQDPFDRRSNKIYLTEKGQSLKEQVIASVKSTIKKAARGLTEEEAKKLRELLSKIYTNLSESDRDTF